MAKAARLLVFAIALGLSWAPTASAGDNAYATRTLAVNRPELAQAETEIVDPLLLNPWGAAIRPAGAGGHIWLANAGSATVTEYVGDVFDGDGVFVPLFQDNLKVVYVDGAPVGQVFSGSESDFRVTAPVCPDSDLEACPAGSRVATVPARFIVSTEEGQIAAWGEVSTPAGPQRFRRFVTTVDTPGALYRGLAVTDRSRGNLLYAANFAQDRVEIYDHRWHRAWWSFLPFLRPFAKPRTVPRNYVPFAVHYLDGRVYVAYAELIQPGDPDFDPADPLAERACAGCGHVVEFDAFGWYRRTLEGRGKLNAPWGMAIAPAGFGPFAGALLVGNFGDGTIVAFDRTTGRQIDYLRDPEGEPVAIDGLWAIFFGNGVSLGRSDFLYFTAGPNGEVDGVLGSVNWIGADSPAP
jgi:uncharacterized protein (TIGR03118 family)